MDSVRHGTGNDGQWRNNNAMAIHLYATGFATPSAWSVVVRPPDRHRPLSVSVPLLVTDIGAVAVLLS
jgi:hypothetical protein